MCQVRFIGCLHLSHKNIAHRRGFQDEFYYDEHLISEWNKIVHKKDLTYILGDVTMETIEPYYLLDRLNGRKIVVLGNHDLPQHVPELLKYVEKVAGMIDYKGCMLTHCPIHPSEISFCRANIHAHIHHKSKLQEFEAIERYGDDGIDTKSLTLHKYINVDAKVINYQPKTIKELVK